MAADGHVCHNNTFVSGVSSCLEGGVPAPPTYATEPAIFEGTGKLVVGAAGVELLFMPRVVSGVRRLGPALVWKERLDRLDVGM